MVYPNLEKTPIKETVFSVSYAGFNNDNCLKKFIDLDFVSNKFPDIKNSLDQVFEVKKEGVSVSSDSSGFDLRNDKEILRIRRGQFSYHYLNHYKKFNLLLEDFIQLWNKFSSLSTEKINLRSCSVRYINLIEIEEDDQASRLIQLYPKYSSDRIIKSFQNTVRFSYKEQPDCEINAVSSKLNDKQILLDITANKTNPTNVSKIESNFEPLQELKNKAFFDSITARALLKYLKIES